MSGAGEEILIEVIPGETLIAVTQGGLLTELFIHRLGEESQEGNIYLGRVIRVVPSIEAAFVELGLDEPGFLDASDARLEQGGGAKISDMLREGDKVLVQVLSDPREDKGAKLTRRINPPEAGAAELEEKQKKMRPPALLSGGQDPIRRVLLERDLNQLHGLSINDSRTLRNLRPFWEGELNLPGDLLHHHKGHPGLFASQDIETQIDEALMPRVGLSSGGSIYIEATEALIAIDVNSGAVATPGSQEDKAIQTNLEAAREILRQMRRELQSLAGYSVVVNAHPSIVDFLEVEEKEAVA
ncbi:MAG: ribonuclease E/G, partial [Rhodospirillales bacterium]|nr:ribonuclease E/G [Rhodospirillales bacterium]